MNSHSVRHEGGATVHAHPNPVKIWGILLVLLTISILGPLMGVPMLTLVTAFGIAIVKAVMVAGYYMHLRIEKRYIWYVFFSGLVALGALFFGLAPDILNQEGVNWQNCHNAAPCLEQRF